jgi:hypothetical protein
MALPMATRKAITEEMAQRFLRTRARALTQRRPQRRRQPCTYSAEIRAPLRKCWAVAGSMCDRRLAPFLPELVAAVE